MKVTPHSFAYKLATKGFAPFSDMTPPRATKSKDAKWFKRYMLEGSEHLRVAANEALLGSNETMVEFLDSVAQGTALLNTTPKVYENFNASIYETFSAYLSDVNEHLRYEAQRALQEQYASMYEAA